MVAITTTTNENTAPLPENVQAMEDGQGQGGKFNIRERLMKRGSKRAAPIASTSDPVGAEPDPAAADETRAPSAKRRRLGAWLAEAKSTALACARPLGEKAVCGIQTAAEHGIALSRPLGAKAVSGIKATVGCGISGTRWAAACASGAAVAVVQQMPDSMESWTKFDGRRLRCATLTIKTPAGSEEQMVKDHSKSATESSQASAYEQAVHKPEFEHTAESIDVVVEAAEPHHENEAVHAHDSEEVETAPNSAVDTAEGSQGSPPQQVSFQVQVPEDIVEENVVAIDGAAAQGEAFSMPEPEETAEYTESAMDNAENFVIDSEPFLNVQATADVPAGMYAAMNSPEAHQTAFETDFEVVDEATEIKDIAIDTAKTCLGGSPDQPFAVQEEERETDVTFMREDRLPDVEPQTPHVGGLGVESIEAVVPQDGTSIVIDVSDQYDPLMSEETFDDEAGVDDDAHGETADAHAEVFAHATFEEQRQETEFDQVATGTSYMWQDPNTGVTYCVNHDGSCSEYLEA